MDTPAKAAHRRAYKRNWMAKRRQAIKAERGEEVRLFLPLQLAADLRKAKPKGLVLSHWLVAELRRIVAKDSGTRAREKPQIPPPASDPPKGADRNKPCPCGCGRKAKDCLAQRQKTVGATIGASVR